MADIRNYLWLRHLRSEPGFHVLRFRRGRLISSARGATFWFLPMNTSVAEIPVGDRELPFLFHVRSRDFQDITVQGVVHYRVTEPETLGERLDFSIDLARGTLLREPLDQLASLWSGHAQQIAVRYVANYDVRTLLAKGLSDIQQHLEAGLASIDSIAEMGVDVVSVQVNGVAPTAELEKALQTPTRESLQEQADKATFDRRALAVENERAISENELQNRIELARRERKLIEERGANDQRRAHDEVETRTIEVNGRAAVTQVEAIAAADRIRKVEGARAAMEKEKMAAYEALSPAVLFALAAQELASKLKTIEHLNITPDLLGPGLSNLLEAGTKKLQKD